MDKSKVLNIFGSAARTAAAIGVSKSAISQWSDDVPQIHVDRVVGAALRLRVFVPEDIVDPNNLQIKSVEALNASHKKASASAID